MAIIVGTLGNDTIIDLNNGNDNIWGDSTGTVNIAVGSDRIFGRGGEDVITGDANRIGPAGRGGNDLIQGGDADDDAYGDAFSTLFGVGGDDTIYQNAGSGVLVGDANDVEAGATGGDDKLFGTGTLVGDSVLGMASATGGDDLLDATRATSTSSLYGDVQEQDLDGTSVGGRDRLFGSAFDDVIVGDAGANVGDGARAGDDLLQGNGGDDALFGDALASLLEAAVGGDDVVRGGAGGDLIYGDAERLEDFAQGGDDRINGGGGDDTLWGDGDLLGDDATGGRDRFFFSGGFGDDTVEDFRQGEDVLVFQGFEEDDFQITLDAGNTVLTSLGDDSVALVGFVDPLNFGVDVLFT